MTTAHPKITITILFDNEVARAGQETGWGFACLLQSGDHTVLFDTAWDGDAVLHNARELGIDVQSISAIVISHNHWDHIGGLSRVLRVTQCPTVYLPASMSKLNKQEIKSRAQVIEVGQDPIAITPNIKSTGELAGDPISEQALVIATNAGAVLLTGCAHPTLSELIAHARCMHPLHAVIGGFHDFNDLDQLSGIDMLVPCHCTKHKGDIEARFPQAVRPAGAGRAFTF